MNKIETDVPRDMEPLSDEEFEELNDFLLDENLSDETMTLDCLDGFLTALVIGPEAVPPSEWLPVVWGPDESHVPQFERPEHAQVVVELFMRHMNGIVSNFLEEPDDFTPLFFTREDEEGGAEFEEAEPWAIGFLQGVEMRRAAWQPLIDDEEGMAWLRPLMLLGADDLSEEEQALVATPAQRHALAQEVSSSVVALNKHWREVRELGYQSLETAPVRREAPKVGRNDPCPCGSGKKFKKCCGAEAV